jgi:hypothetical protein
MSPNGPQQRCGSVKPANDKGLIPGGRMEAITLRLPVWSASSLTSICLCVNLIPSFHHQPSTSRFRQQSSSQLPSFRQRDTSNQLKTTDSIHKLYTRLQPPSPRFDTSPLPRSGRPAGKTKEPTLNLYASRETRPRLIAF